jgi:hypothetical protein
MAPSLPAAASFKCSKFMLLQFYLILSLDLQQIKGILGSQNTDTVQKRSHVLMTRQNNSTFQGQILKVSLT